MDFEASSPAEPVARRKRVVWLAVLCGLVLGSGPAAHGESPAFSRSYFDDWSDSQKALAVNLGIVAGVTLYGVGQWGWGESSFSFQEEGWFENDTKFGGADKLGHAYTGAAVTALAAACYRCWGVDEERVPGLGALSGLVTTTVIEIGDGFSNEHGFSWEDQVANVAGVGLEYLRQRYPAVRERVQFRWEYFPSSEVRSGRQADILTDYEGSRWMLAFPLQAWIGEDSWLRWFDVLVGYGTRGYSDGGGHGDRHPFVGIGISLPQVKEEIGIGGPVRVLEYYQVPGTAYPLPP